MLYLLISTIPMFACLFWTIHLLLEFKQNNRAKRFLTLFMGVASLLYFCHYAYFNKCYEILPFTESIYAFTTLSVYPLYYLYIKLLSDSQKLRWSDYSLLIPSFLASISCAIIYLMMNSTERTNYLSEYVFSQSQTAEATPLVQAQQIRYKLTGLALALQIIPILFLGSKKITDYNKNVSNYYANTEGKTFSGIHKLLIFFVFTSCISFIVNLIGKQEFTDSTWMITIPSLLFGTLLFSLGFIGNKLNFTSIEFHQELSQHDSAVCNEKPHLEIEDLTKSIVELIEARELYRQTDIKISDIANLLCTNRTYISSAINRDLQVSFSTLINGYRVNYAKQLILESLTTNSKLSKSDIIEQSGFSNETSFYRSFRAVTGTTPQKWADEQLLSQKVI